MEEIVEVAEFTDKQLRDALKQIGIRAKQSAFEKHRPIFVFRDGHLIALHRDGSTNLIQSAKEGTDLIDGSK